MRLYTWSVLVFSVIFVGLGIALLARTAAEGGGTVGFVVGGLFVVLGVARLMIERKRRGP